MPFACTALSVLFTGPSDTADLVRAGTEEVHRWNSARAQDFGPVLIPRHYSTDAVSLFAIGNDGQGVINEQLVDDADIVISVFRGRFGTSTPRAPSGTAEEIQRTMTNEARLHVYFADEVPDLREKDPREQWDRLQEFKRELTSGLWDTFDSPAKFQELVHRAIERAPDRQ